MRIPLMLKMKIMVMKMKMSNKLLFFLSLVFSLRALAISPELTYPRIGDKVTILKLQSGPAWTDSLCMCPNLTNVPIYAREPMKVWAPSRNDSSAYCLIAKGRESIRLAVISDTLYQLDRIVPGRSLFYMTMPAYGFINDDNLSLPIKASGITENIGKYTMEGTWSFSKAKSLSLVTFDGDSIDDIECITTDINEKLVYINNDSTMYQGVIKRWYAPGYRYPLLSHEKGVLLSMTGDTLDYISSWYAIDPSEIIAEVENDYINELIRNRYAIARQYVNSNPSDNKEHSKHERSDNNIVYYDIANNKIVINPSSFSDNDANRAYILCDISGIVYAYGNTPSEGSAISTSGLNPGTYLLYISTANEAIVYKFSIFAP